MGLGREVVIVDYLRSPFSKASPKAPEKDVFNYISMPEVLGILWKEMIRRKNLDPKLIQEATVGTNFPYGEQFSVSGKLPTWWAGMPFEVSAHQCEQACGSALIGMRSLAMSIGCGYCDVAMAGGFEHMTHIPIQAPTGDLFVRWQAMCPNIDLVSSMTMGLAAQKLAHFAKIPREEMDRYSVRSHQLTYKNRDWLKGEIMPVEALNPDGTKFMLDYDVPCRPDTSMEGLAKLKPMFGEDGTVTAGNSSPLTDGATGMLIMSRDMANKLGYKPIASFVSFGVEGVEPSMLTSTVAPAKQALKNAGLQVKDITSWEIHEAFAVVPLYCMRELGVPEEKVDVHGGALAIGHPLGSSGLRYVGTLARTLQEKGTGKYGLVTMCEGGGQGISCIIKSE